MLKISIPIEDTVPTAVIKKYKLGISYPQDKTSVLNSYNIYKKLSRYITSYLFWLYSKYLKEKNEKISLDTMYTFRKKYITIIPDFRYGYVGKNFDMRSGVMKDNKLVLKSEESLKRLMYTLRVFSRQRTKTTKLLCFREH